MIQGAVFDFDGTLFDSMSLWDTVGDRYLLSLGKTPEPDLAQKIKPLSLQQAARYLMEAYALPCSERAVMDGINRMVETDYFCHVLPKDGVIPLLEQLRESGVTMAVATATDRYMVEAALGRCGMAAFFCDILSCTDLGHGKDEPVIYRTAMERLCGSRQNTIVVEDSLFALKTAKADGFYTVGVRDPYEKAPEEMRVLADVYLEDYFHTEAFWRFVSAH